MSNAKKSAKKNVKKNNSYPADLLGMPIAPVVPEALALELNADPSQVFYCAFVVYRNWAPLQISKRKYWGWTNQTFWVDYNTFKVWWDNAPDELKSNAHLILENAPEPSDLIRFLFCNEDDQEWAFDNGGRSQKDLVKICSIPRSMAEEVFAHFMDDESNTHLWRQTGFEPSFSVDGFRDWYFDQYPEIVWGFETSDPKFMSAEDLCEMFHYERGPGDIVMRYAADHHRSSPSEFDENSPWYEGPDKSIYVNVPRFVEWLMDRRSLQDPQTAFGIDRHRYFKLENILVGEKEFFTRPYKG